MAFLNEYLQKAHKHSFLNEAEIKQSEICGCFYCRQVYPPNKIQEWTDDGKTAICPLCWIDSVIGSASGYPAQDSAFLDEMAERWF